MRLIATAALALLALTSACGSDSPTGSDDNPTTLTNGTFGAKVNGNALHVVFATVVVSGNIISVGGGNITGEAIGMAWVDAGVGTYPISVTTTASANYSYQGNAWIASAQQGSGSIVVTTRTANHVAGTFSFVAPAGPGLTGTKTVTNGSFDLTF